MWSHANLGPRDVWGASTGTCKSAFAKFSIGVQAQAHPVFVPDRRAGCVHSFFWYCIYGRTESYSMCSHILRGGSVKDFPCPAVFCIHACITDEMRNFFTGRATRFARPPSPVAPPLRARARNEGPNRRFGLTGPLGRSVLVILMCGEPRSDISGPKRKV